MKIYFENNLTMILVKQNQAKKIVPDSSTKIWEYLMDDDEVSGAVTEINGRYPENGFAYNEKSKEMVYVISGNGKIVQPNAETSINTGDMLIIDRYEKFAWEGNLKLLLVTLPKFDPNQHKIVLD